MISNARLASMGSGGGGGTGAGGGGFPLANADPKPPQIISNVKTIFLLIN
jgi:hypothetical protein